MNINIIKTVLGKYGSEYVISGDHQRFFEGFAPIKRAKATEITFWKHDNDMPDTDARIIFLNKSSKVRNKNITVILVNNPRLEFFRVVRELFHIRVPEIVISPDSKIHPSAVIGKPGFAFVRNEKNELEEIPHHGGVYIGNNVSIGSNTSIDRGVMDNTWIGDGAKIDNNVHIGHHARVGNHCSIVAGSVIGGGAIIGDYTEVGMNASIRDNIKIGEGCLIGANAYVSKDLPDNTVMGGSRGEILKTGRRIS